MQTQCSNAILSLSFPVLSIFYVALVSSFLLHDSNAFVITVGTPHSLFMLLLTSSNIEISREMQSKCQRYLLINLR